MDAFQAAFSTSLKDKLEKEILDKSLALATTAAADHPSYMRRVGLVEGLRFALQMASEIESELSRPEGKTIETKRRQGYET